MAPIQTIIGICGRKSHGKTTIQKHLCSPIHGFKPLNFADPIKQICMDTWGFSLTQMNDHLLKEQVVPEWGFSPREAMQKVGKNGRELHPETWIRKCIRTVQDSPTVNWCIGDIRYPNEAEGILAAFPQALILKVVRSGLEDSDHESESSVDSVVVAPHHTIQNNGTSEQLCESVSTIVANHTHTTTVANVSAAPQRYREPTVNQVMKSTGVSYAQANIAVKESGGDYFRAVEYLRKNMRMR